MSASLSVRLPQRHRQQRRDVVHHRLHPSSNRLKARQSQQVECCSSQAGQCTSAIAPVAVGILVELGAKDPVPALNAPFVLKEQIGSVSSFFKRYENVPTTLADAALIQLAEMNDSPLLITTDSDFHVYRRHGRQTIPLVSP